MFGLKINSKSQVGLEMFFGFAAVLLFFLASLVWVTNNNAQSRNVANDLENISDCVRISSLVTETFILGDGSSINFSSSKPFYVINGDIIIDSISCSTYAKIPDGNFPPGDFQITNSNNFVVVTNV